MIVLPSHLAGLDPAVETFIRQVLDNAAEIRLPALTAGRHEEAAYWVPDRHGLTTLILRTGSLTQQQLVAIMSFRQAQYLLANQLDPALLYAARSVHEPIANASPADLHMLTLATATGEILSYATAKGVSAPPELRMSDEERPLFPVEEVFGAGVFRRLRALPDLPSASVREAGRLMKSHQHEALDELVARAPVETILAFFRICSEVPSSAIAACVGDIEVNVAKKNQDFFHLPTVIIRGVVPYAPEGSYGYFNYQTRTRYPYAFLCSDIRLDRLNEVERALERPGKEGLMALLELKKTAMCPRSSLEPAGGLPALDAVDMRQEGVSMAVRRQLLDIGEWLRGTKLFGGLSVPEAAVLGTFMERCDVASGTAIMQQGAHGDDLYLIESGIANVRVRTGSGKVLTVKELGAGDYFGEIALVTGGERTADVIAETPMTLLRLSHDSYARYLAQMVEVEADLTRTALTRTHETLRKLRESDS